MKARSHPASLAVTGQVTKHTPVKWPILHNLCFPFLLGITVVPRKTACGKFWEANKVYYGRCGNGEL